MTQVDTAYQLDTARNHPQNASAFRGARWRGIFRHVVIPAQAGIQFAKANLRNYAK